MCSPAKEKIGAVGGSYCFFADICRMINSDSIPVVTVPASKSISNRLLLLRRTALPGLRIASLSDADDTLRLRRLLMRTLHPSYKSFVDLDVGNCGTAFRFLLPYLAQLPGRWRLVGDERLAHRPIRPLVELLRGWGAEIALPGNGSLPVEITGSQLLHPRSEWVDVSESSQFLSALLLTAPVWGKRLCFRYDRDSSSASYLRMTVGLMRSLGFPLRDGPGLVEYNPPVAGSCRRYWRVDGDWSSAAFWWAWTALQEPHSALYVSGLAESGLQPDACIHRLLSTWGLHTTFSSGGAFVEKVYPLQLPEHFRMDARNCIDLVPLMSVLCLLLRVPCTFDGVANLQAKESRRADALRVNLQEMASLTFSEGRLTVLPLWERLPESCLFRSFGDHRIVMALNLFSAFTRVRFDDPDAVTKSYPDFWRQFSIVRQW